MNTNLKSVLELLAELSEQAKEMKPAVRTMLGSLGLYAPEVVEVLDGVSDFLVDRRAASVKRFEDKHGFTREEAITLTLDVHSRIERKLKQAVSSSSK